MLALDLFNTKYEQDLREGAVDDLEARRIDTLNDRMQDLLARAKEPAYQANPAALAALKKQFQQVKDERDNYYKVREAGIPGSIPTEKIPGKEDLLKGRGRTYYEGAEDYAEIYSPEAIALGKRFCEHYNITDDMDVQFAVEIIDSYLDEFKASGEPVDLKKIKSGVADAFRQANRGLGVAGPNFRKKFQETQKKNSEAGPLDQKLQRLKVQARRQFPRAHTDDEALVLKLLDKEIQDDQANRRTDARQDAELRKNFALDREQDDDIDNLQTQVSVKEHGGGIGPRQRWQDLMPEQANPEDYDDYEDEDQDLRLRSGDYVRDTMDGESGEVFRMQGDPEERRVRILDRDGKGWYIEPGRLTRVDPTDPDVQRYFGKNRQRDMDEAVDEKGALKAAQAAAKFIIRNLDDRAALKDYSMHFWSPTKFYQGATMAMRGAGVDEIVQAITQDRPAQFETKADPTGSWVVYGGNKVVKFKTHTGAKAYAEKNGGKVASSEYYADKISQPGVAEGWSDRALAQRTGGPRTPYSVYIKGKKWKDFENEELAQAVMNKLKAKFKADGRDPETITIAPADYDQPIKEDNDSEAVERAILNRIMVAHTDLLMKFGPDKVMQAAEEVAYNVGDVDEIGTSDVSAYVAQVKQILGATP